MSQEVDPAIAPFMRKKIASHISNNPETYNEAFLEKSNQDYCEFIMKPGSWGGGIEISILSKYYGIEIAVVNRTSGLINHFGEDKPCKMRAFLLYDGTHYEPLYTLQPV